MELIALTTTRPMVTAIVTAKSTSTGTIFVRVSGEAMMRDTAATAITEAAALAQFWTEFSAAHRVDVPGIGLTCSKPSRNDILLIPGYDPRNDTNKNECT